MDIIDGIWNNFLYKPALTKQLEQYLNDEAEWVIETGKVEQNTIPNFRKYIYDKPLKTITNEQVTI